MASFRNLNKVQLIGNVGKEPEFREYGSNKDKELARFSVATSESWKNKQSGEWENSTEWHNVVVFNKHLVEMVRRHVTAGTMVYVEGALKTRSYEKDDVKHYITEITLGNFDGEIKVLVRGADVADGAGNEPEDEEDPFKDDIPF